MAAKCLLRQSAMTGKSAPREFHESERACSKRTSTFKSVPKGSW